MNSRQTALCVFYALIAVAALAGTLGQIKPYLALGVVQGNVHFWQDTLVNAASRFITVDIMFVFVVVWRWMLTEGRRLRMRGYFWYLPASLLIAFSAALPVFMIHREIARSRLSQVEQEDTGTAGAISVLLTTAVALGYTWRAFMVN
ncbi:MAG: DUF2834 domain-containing protein [Aquabacterium sp.]|nr:DUF2834 domain-containing protein [Aquabacterium sp.]